MQLYSDARQLANDAADHAESFPAITPWQQERLSHWILWLTFGFFVIALIWAKFATLDEVTRGKGKIIPSSRIQVIQNLEGGILAEILVGEGDLVEKNQALLRLDDIRFSSSYKETQLKHLELLAKTARLSAEVKQQDFKAPDEVIEQQPGLVEREQNLFQSRQEELETNLAILEQQVRQRDQERIEQIAKKKQLQRSYGYLKRELEMSEPLVADGALSEVEMLRLRRSVNDLRGELNAVELSIPRIESALDEARSKIIEQKQRFRTQAIGELNEAKGELGRISESIVALQDRVTRTKITSPVRGTIKRLKINTIGGVVQPGMDLVEIVPIEDQLLVEAKIRPSDIAFLRPGQDAVVKLTAYDFSIYGGLSAKLEHISADSITDKKGDSFYVIRLRTEKNYLRKEQDALNVITGMTTEVDILTGRKTVLEYLLKPVLKAKQVALRER